MVDEQRRRLHDAGLTASLLVRDLRTGREIGIDPDLVMPAASLVKVPLALATLQRIHRGELDGAAMLDVPPGRVSTPGPTGLSRFVHPARVAVADLVYLSVALSDGVAADALFGLTPPRTVAAELAALGLRGLTVRHRVHELVESPAERLDGMPHLAHALAINAGTQEGGHLVRQLDMTRSNTGTARAFTELLQALWTPSSIDPLVSRRLRELLGHTVFRQRLAPDFTSDTARWSSKTGTLLNLRHEIGVVEHSDGGVYAVAVLTRSEVPAAQQPAAEAVMALVARTLRDELRDTTVQAEDPGSP